MTKLAAAIARDLLAERPRKQEATECFACGRSYTPKALAGDDSTRFCSSRCRDAFDAGVPPYDLDDANKLSEAPASAWRVVVGSDPGYLPRMPMRRGKVGFWIACAGCAKTFDSKGLRCCSIQCERDLSERREVARLKDEAGISFESKMGPKRKCQECGGDIPRWRNGRQVSRATRFCSSKCGQRSRKGGSSPNPVLVAET